MLTFPQPDASLWDPDALADVGLEGMFLLSWDEAADNLCSQGTESQSWGCSHSCPERAPGGAVRTLVTRYRPLSLATILMQLQQRVSLPLYVVPRDLIFILFIRTQMRLTKEGKKPLILASFK